MTGGSIEFVHGDKTVKLQVQEAAKAEVRLCFEDIDLKKEKKKGSEIIIAHIFDTLALPLFFDTLSSTPFSATLSKTSISVTF